MDIILNLLFLINVAILVGVVSQAAVNTTSLPQGSVPRRLFSE